jgi:RNA methyltransferase, TrmH family
MTITSLSNPRLKQLRKLQRTRERARSGLFVVEGEDLVLSAFQAGRKAVEGFRASGADVAGERFPGGEGFRVLGAELADQGLRGDERFHEVDAAVLGSVSTLGSGTRVIAIYEQRWGTPSGPLCVYLHGVRDPGNVGTVLRSAHAFGASCVVLGPGCADPHSPKAVRASMGAIFSVELARTEHVSDLPGERIALVAGAGEPLWEVGRDIAQNGPRARTHAPARGSASEEQRHSGATSDEQRHSGVALLVGSERDGLPDELVRECERVAYIPISSESLNAAMATTVALYEIARSSTRVPT